MEKFLIKLKIVINYLKNIKNQKLHIEKDICNAAGYKLQKIIIKKRAFFENKLTESIGKPKYLWKTLKSLGLP